jgi:hypothetical protein
MPVLMIAEQPNLDAATYAAMIDQLTPALRSANGFVSHTGGPSPAGGSRLIEVSATEADSQQFFDAHLKPNLPLGLVPNMKYYALQTAFSR